MDASTPRADADRAKGGESERSSRTGGGAKARRGEESNANAGASGDDRRKRKGPCVELEDVHVSFGDHHVLQGVSVRVEHGETIVLMGESGGGKTVLLK